MLNHFLVNCQHISGCLSLSALFDIGCYLREIYLISSGWMRTFKPQLLIFSDQCKSLLTTWWVGPDSVDHYYVKKWIGWNANGDGKNNLPNPSLFFHSGKNKWPFFIQKPRWDQGHLNFWVDVKNFQGK